MGDEVWNDIDGIERPHDDDEQRNVAEGVYQLISFDLVGSTEFKTARSNWPTVMQKFYHFARKEILDSVPSAMQWKLVGDEILFYVKIRKIADVADVIQGTFDALCRVDKEMRRERFSGYKSLAVKGATWIARCFQENSLADSGSAESERTQNLIFFTGEAPFQDVDFIGPDIDIGFRISKYTFKGKLVVSANLGYFLSLQEHSLRDRLKVVEYAVLKGVWSGRRYPIVWYDNNWDEVSGRIQYDEALESPLLRRVFDGDFESVAALQKVYSDVGISNEAAELKTAIDESSADAHFDLIDRARVAEIHCVAACIRNGSEVLIARRAKHKRNFAGKWEFGCGQLKRGESFSDCLKRAVMNDFNVDIEVLDRLPFADYEIPVSSGVVPGLIWRVSCTNDDVKINPEKHESHKWVSLQDLSEIREADCVEGLVDNIRRALSDRAPTAG